MDVLVGRQPIFGRNLEVYGYELLYRDSAGRGLVDQDPDAATSRVILGACTEIGLERIVGARRAFINLTLGFVLGRVALPLARDRDELEVLEDVPATPEVLAGLRDLARRGYVIALDDYGLQPERRPLLDVAHIVKVELPAVHSSALVAIVAELQERGLEVLAEKIETQDEYEQCREAGFDLFQGYFLSKPHLIQGRVMPTNRLALVREVAEALLRHSGPYGEVLECVLAYERGEWERVRCGLLPATSIRDAFLDAVEWAGAARAESRTAA